MRTSEQGLQLIRTEEAPGGVPALKAYMDDKYGRVWTIGYGHTRGVRKGMVITPEQAEAFLLEDVAEAEAIITQHLPAAVLAALPQAAWNALASFVLNLGVRALYNTDGSLTGVHRALLAFDWAGVAREMRRWVYDNGHKLDGLVNRRAREVAMWNSAWETSHALA